MRLTDATNHTGPRKSAALVDELAIDGFDDAAIESIVPAEDPGPRNMKPRTLEEVIELLRRVTEHCSAGPWSAKTTARLKADRKAYKADPDPAVDTMSIFDYSPTIRWIASWNRRREVVVAELRRQLEAMGVPELLCADFTESPR